MAYTTNANIDTSISEVWRLEALKTYKVNGFWARFGGTALVQSTELLNRPGDLVHVQVTNPLAGAGITGDESTLTGNEENLATTEIKLATLQYRHAVGIFRRAEKKSILSLANEMRFRLDEWWMNKRDNELFTLFTGLTSAVLPASLVGETYVPNQVSFDSAAASGLDSTTPHIDDVDADDFITVKGIQALKLKLRLQMAVPIIVDGHPVYVMVTHPNATFNLKQDTRYEAWVREAERRGADNPLFRGALAMIDGMVIHDHENVPRPTNTGTFKVARSLAFGAEAFVEVLDENVRYREGEITDYDNKFSLGLSVAYSARRALELSSIQVYAGAPDV